MAHFIPLVGEAYPRMIPSFDCFIKDDDHFVLHINIMEAFGFITDHDANTCRHAREGTHQIPDSQHATRIQRDEHVRSRIERHRKAALLPHSGFRIDDVEARCPTVRETTPPVAAEHKEMIVKPAEVQDDRIVVVDFDADPWTAACSRNDEVVLRLLAFDFASFVATE